MRGRRSRAARRGQATIELILTLFAFCTIFFMYIQSSMGFAVANYIQYATFMGARAYQAADGSSGAQLTNANFYLDQMLGAGGNRFGNMAKPTGSGLNAGYAPNLSPGSRLNNWQVGVTFTYKANLFLAPLIPGMTSSSGQVQLQSQSWLGQDPNNQDCTSVMTGIKGKSGALGLVIFDNGC